LKIRFKKGAVMENWKFMFDDVIGVCGWGRVGKPFCWLLIRLRLFREIVVNIGRKPGKKFEDAVLNYFNRDSTYGRMEKFLFGFDAKPIIKRSDIKVIDKNEGTFIANGVLVRVVRKSRNPKDSEWAKYGVEIVVDTTGKFLDPTAKQAEDEKGNGVLEGHLLAGAKKVLVSAPFKIKDKTKLMPPNACTIMPGINEDMLDNDKYNMISDASCTSMCLAHMLKPQKTYYGDDVIASIMITIHSITKKQPGLDGMPEDDKEDLRIMRSQDNIIPTTTGAAKAVVLLMEEVKKMAFLASSIRVPVRTVSLVALMTVINNPVLSNPATAEEINNIYKSSATLDERGHLVYDEEQNVSSDFIGNTAAAVIESTLTEAKVVNFSVPIPDQVPEEIRKKYGLDNLTMSQTVAAVFGWYDNEIGYVMRLIETATELFKRKHKRK